MKGQFLDQRRSEPERSLELLLMMMIKIKIVKIIMVAARIVLIFIT